MPTMELVALGPGPRRAPSLDNHSAQEDRTELWDTTCGSITGTIRERDARISQLPRKLGQLFELHGSLNNQHFSPTPGHLLPRQQDLDTKSVLTAQAPAVPGQLCDAHGDDARQYSTPGGSSQRA